MLRQYADIPIRLLIGFHLIYGTQDNVFSWNRMLEFRDFLEAHHMPYPLIAAIISVYAQFICGALFIIGWRLQLAGLVMVFNFLVAIILVHLSDPYPQVFPALTMLLGAVFMILNRGGKLSLDSWLDKKKSSV